MKLDISHDDALFLARELSRRLGELQSELVHTTDRELHHALAADVDRLAAILAPLQRMIDEKSAYA